MADSEAQSVSGNASRTAAGTPTLNTLRLPPLFIRGVFRNPLGGEDLPLPPHRWSIQPVGGAATLDGSKSDAVGVSRIRTDASVHQPGKLFELTWKPEGASLGSDREIWVDLDKNDWVQTQDVKRLEKRRLVRLVSFSTSEKANRRGGHLISPTTRFQTAGVLEAKDMVPLLFVHGSRDEAWILRVDHNLFRTYLRFHYFDTNELTTRSVPTGLVVEATTKDDVVVGAGTAIDPDGLIYVLHARTKELSHDLFYRFETSDPVTAVNNRVFEEPFPGFENAVEVRDSVGRVDRMHYDLPRRWHAKGWEARSTERVPWPESPPDPTDPTPPDDIRTTSTFAEVPLVFHLDDTVLTDEAGKPIRVARGDRHTIFDNELRIRRPTPFFKHLTTPDIERNYFPAERDIVPESSDRGIRALTRLIDRDGVLHDVLAARVIGTMNKTLALGARAARANDHPFVDHRSGAAELGQTFRGSFELHLIDTMIEADYPIDDENTVKTPLHHLLVYQSATLLGVPSNVRQLLEPAAALWVRGHSGMGRAEGEAFPDTIVPRNLDEGDPAVLVRYFFTERKTPKPGGLRIRVREKFFGTQRGHFDPPSKTMELELSNLQGERTLAHEFGHTLNLPDEYAERIADTELLTTNQRQDGSSRVKPYLRDGGALMNHNFWEPERLRYFWHHVHALNNAPAFQNALGAHDFIAQNLGTTYTGKERYELPSVPASVLADEKNKSPWVELGHQKPPSTHLLATLYRMGYDTGPGIMMFGGRLLQTPAGENFEPDGILILRLAVKMVGLRLRDRKDAALKLYRNVTTDANYAQAQRTMFMVTSDTSAALARVAIDWQLFFSVGSEPGPIDLRIQLLPEKSTVPNPLLQPANARPALLRLKASDMTHAVYRHALGVPTTDASGALITSPLTTTEVAGSNLVGALQSLLKESPGIARNIVQAAADGKVPV